MVTIPTNLTIHTAKPVKDDSIPFPYPVKIITGCYRTQESATTGISDENQAIKLMDSFAGTEALVDVVLWADGRSRISGHMYMEGTYGEFLFITHYGLYYYIKAGGVWSQKIL